MASTYSSLKIQLMATGENSGTWGNVTNVNLGTALEEAIVGSADVSFSSADVTLTLTDSNASQAARNLRLNLTGTSGGARNLVVPAIEKIYLVNNGLADAVTVKNSTGTGIAVPAGKTMWVYNNGTNVVDAVTHLTSLTLGTPLAIAQGGTGTTSTTFANLQSNVTGTLPIANGGTGTTSTTFANLQSNVSGTLPIANGGTGSTSTTYCNLQSNVTGVLPNANTTASSSNGASTIVARDSSGNFAGNIISDAGGNLRTIPQNSKTTSYTLAVGDIGEFISTNSSVTVPNGTFSGGDVVSIYNTTSSNITVIQGASTTLTKAGSTTTGNATLLQYGIATVLCTGANTFVITGTLG